MVIVNSTKYLAYTRICKFDVYDYMFYVLRICIKHFDYVYFIVHIKFS